MQKIDKDGIINACTVYREKLLSGESLSIEDVRVISGSLYFLILLLEEIHPKYVDITWEKFQKELKELKNLKSAGH